MRGIQTNSTNKIFLGKLTYKKSTANAYSKYELKNHLGNVLNVITDRKLPYDSNSDGTVDYYTADVVSYSDYYPFGMQMPGRHGSSSDDYRYAFNGMEQDDEVKGNGNSYTTQFRQYDPRVGRWLSLDPLSSDYPSFSDYQYVHNNPILILDMHGLGDPLKVMKIRKNRASNLQGRVRNGGKRAHQGFDLYAPSGTPTMAVKNSRVHTVRYSEAYGKQIVLEITDDKGLKSYAFYAHLSKINVKKGQIVEEGDVIGETGQTGNAKGQPASDAHLHFEYRSVALPGKGLAGRKDVNEVLDTKFHSQDESANQTLTGVVKVEKNGTRTEQNLNGSEKVLSTPKLYTNREEIPEVTVVGKKSSLSGLPIRRPKELKTSV